MADTPQRPKARAFGRSIGDFGELNEAEHELIGAACQGWRADFGTGIPATLEERAKRTIRAGLVRFLALGGGDATPVHEKGVRIRGAFIDGDLDLEGCTLEGNLELENCELSGTLTLRNARTRNISLEGTRCRDIKADAVEVSGAFLMRQGFVASGPVRLLGAKIDSTLECDGGRFEGSDSDGDGLICDRIEVGGSIFLHQGFVAKGAVRLLGAKISGNLSCDNGRFEGQDKDGNVLACALAKIGGGVYMRAGFVAAGTVLLIGAAIDGDVTCNGGTFGAAQAGPAVPRELTLNLARATIAGTLWLTERQNAVFHGGVSLVGARIGRVVDAVTQGAARRLPGPAPAGVDRVPASVRLDGLVYDRFGETTDLSGHARIAFLDLQREVDLGKEFKPQPWMQMVKVLRETGHTEAARRVAIAFEDRWREAGHFKGLLIPLHWLYGRLVGYGHRPMRLLAIMIGVWLACGLLYQNAAEQGWFAPTHAAYFQNPRHQSCRPENGGNWVKCAGAPEYTTFNALTYSLDLIVPFVDLQQDKDWAPIVDKGPLKPGELASPFTFGAFVRLVMWFEILFGWMASALLAAVLTGLAKRVE